MKVLEGIVVSIKMNRTAVVEVSRRTPHPLYRKLIKRSKKHKADTNGIEVYLGNVVKIAETRPVSKGKYFKITEIIGKRFVKKASIEAIQEVAEEIAQKPAKSLKVPEATKPVKKTARKTTKKEEKKL